MDTDELLLRLDSGDAVVIDVRTEPGYVGGHLPGAPHLPLEELAERLEELLRDREIVAYCRGQYCVLAHHVARLLSARMRGADDGGRQPEAVKPSADALSRGSEREAPREGHDPHLAVGDRQ